MRILERILSWLTRRPQHAAEVTELDERAQEVAARKRQARRRLFEIERELLRRRGQ